VEGREGGRVSFWFEKLMNGEKKKRQEVLQRERKREGMGQEISLLAMKWIC